MYLWGKENSGTLSVSGSVSASVNWLGFTNAYVMLCWSAKAGTD